MKINHKDSKLKSLGKLRKNTKTKSKSPNLIGQLVIQPHTLKQIVDHFKRAGEDEVVCNIAAWMNRDEFGRYLTIELSPPFVPKRRKGPKADVWWDHAFNKHANSTAIVPNPSPRRRPLG